MNIIDQVNSDVKKMVQDEIDLNARSKFIDILSKIGISDEKISSVNGILDDLDKQMAHESYRENYTANE
ncbi:hypothetical protein ACI3ER_11425 [Bacillus sp. Wb]